jgi:hypothetical protein
MVVTAQDIKSIEDIAILNELIETYVFKGERESTNLKKRQLVSRDGKIINPRNFCDDDEMVIKLINAWARKSKRFTIGHDPMLPNPFVVNGSRGFNHSANHLGRALCKVILMEILVDGK